MFSPMFSFSFGPTFAVPVPSDDSPSPDRQPDGVSAIQTAIPDVPVTVVRPVFNPDPGTTARLPSAGTARAHTAPSADSPQGTPGWAAAHARQSVLQQHCAFFDPDGDGVVSPLDTFRGLRALGLALPACAAATLLTHALFSWPTSPGGMMPDWRGRIWLERVHLCKHGSDSGVFDGEGRFVPQKFEDFFAKYGQKEGIHSNRLWEAVRAQRVLLDPVGWLGAAMAWFLTYTLLQPDSSGFIKKEDIRRVFDGSIFEEIARRRAAEAERFWQDGEGDGSRAGAGKRPSKKGKREKED